MRLWSFATGLATCWMATVVAILLSTSIVLAQDGHYLVFFDYERTLVTAEGQKVLDQAVAEFKSGRAQRINVIGHTDSAETSPDLLSAARSQAIASVLIAKGVPVEKIEMSGSGAKRQMAPTKPRTKEPINRRAEVILK